MIHVKLIRMLTVFIGLCLFLMGCQLNEPVPSYINTEATEKLLNQEKQTPQYPNIGNNDIFDFRYIKGAPQSDQHHDVHEIIKLYGTTWSLDEFSYPIVIDIEHHELYEKADIDHYGVRSEESIKKVDDIEKVLDLVHTYDVLSWQNYYSNVKEHHSYEDGTSWSLIVQYKDGTIETFRGVGTQFDEIIPENYHDFMNELATYVNAHLDK